MHCDSLWVPDKPDLSWHWAMRHEYGVTITVSAVSSLWQVQSYHHRSYAVTNYTSKSVTSIGVQSPLWQIQWYFCGRCGVTMMIAILLPL